MSPIIFSMVLNSTKALVVFGQIPPKSAILLPWNNAKVDRFLQKYDLVFSPFFFVFLYKFEMFIHINLMF